MLAPVPTVWLIGDGERRGAGTGTYEKLVPVLRPAKTEETVSHRQNNNDKEVGTPPVGSNLCTSLIAVSKVARNKVA